MMVLVGMMVYHLKPLDSKAPHNAFTNWLEGYLKDPDAELEFKLRSLSSEEKALDDVIREASELVSDHRDDFDLPISEQEQDGSPYELLLTQWKNYQHAGNGMGKAILLQPSKTLSILPDHFLSLSGFSNVKSSALPKPLVLYSNTGSGRSEAHSHLIAPHLGGLAINAP